jgi:hypothetical protein
VDLRRAGPIRPLPQADQIPRDRCPLALRVAAATRTAGFGRPGARLSRPPSVIRDSRFGACRSTSVTGASATSAARSRRCC